MDPIDPRGRPAEPQNRHGAEVDAFRDATFTHLDRFHDVRESIQTGWSTGYLPAIFPHRPESLVAPVISELGVVLDVMIRAKVPDFIRLLPLFHEKLRGVAEQIQVLFEYEQAWSDAPGWKGPYNGDLEDRDLLRIQHTVNTLLTECLLCNSLDGASQEHAAIRLKRVAVGTKTAAARITEHLAHD